MSNYDSETTTTTTTSSGGFLDRAYYRGIPAITTALEVVFCLIAFICVAVSPFMCGMANATTNYFKFCSMLALFVAAIMWVFGLFRIPQRICRCDCVNWPFFSFVIYIVTIILLFFGDLFLAIGVCSGEHKAGAAFGFFALFVFVFDVIMSFRIWWTSRSSTTTTSSSSTTTTTTTATAKY